MLSRRTPEYAVRRMVSAISSAIDSSVLRNSSNAIESEVHAARAARAARPRAIDAKLVGNARPVGNALADHPQAHDLDRLLGARAMPVRPFVLTPEGLVQSGERFGIDRAGGDGYRQLERLAFVAAIG